MSRTEKILSEEEIRKDEILQQGLKRKLCYFFVFNNAIAFRDLWAPKMKKKYYKTRFYQYAPALSNDLTWGGARTIGKSDDLVFSLIGIALKFKNKKSLLTAFRKIHVKDRLEDLISSLVNEPYLRKFFHGDADKSLRDSVVRTPIYHIKFKNGHEIKGISVGDDPAAVMIQGEHPNFRMIEECIPGETLVTLENTQQKSIKEIVEKKEECKVLSWNGKKLESKRIVNFFEREAKELLEFTAVRSQPGKKKEHFKFRCTTDHKILTLKGYTKASELDIKYFEDEIFLLVKKNQKEKCLWINEIKTIKKIQGNFKVYDIEVEDNHNFFANNFLVSNCQSYPEASWIKFQSTQAPEGSVDRYYGTRDGRMNTPFHLINHKLSKFKGKRFFISRLMEPFFDQKKKEDYIQAFGSEQSNEYQQQVMALEGEPSWSLWSQGDILKNIDITETKLGILANNMMTIRISKVDIELGLTEKIGDSKDPKLIQVALKQVFDEVLINLPDLPSSNLEVILGIDAGWTSPTVILPFFFHNNKWNLHCKILLTDKMIPDHQALVIDYVATKYNSLVGIDTSDGEGKALATALANPAREEFAGKNYQERVIWIEFQRTMMTGKKPDGTEMLEKIKDKTTKLLQNWFSESLFNIYHDEDFLVDFDKEVLKRTSAGTFIHTPQDVHIPEAMRVFIYAWFDKHGKIELPSQEEEMEEFTELELALPEKGNLNFGLFGRPSESQGEGLA